jgi:hypothetical protein
MRLSSVFGGEVGGTSVLTDTVSRIEPSPTARRPTSVPPFGRFRNAGLETLFQRYSDPGHFRRGRRVQTRDSPRLDDSQPARVCP